MIFSKQQKHLILKVTSLKWTCKKFTCKRSEVGSLWYHLFRVLFSNPCARSAAMDTILTLTEEKSATSWLNLVTMVMRRNWDKEDKKIKDINKYFIFIHSFKSSTNMIFLYRNSSRWLGNFFKKELFPSTWPTVSKIQYMKVKNSVLDVRRSSIVSFLFPLIAVTVPRNLKYIFCYNTYNYQWHKLFIVNHKT